VNRCSLSSGQFYKKRVAQASFYERKLASFLPLFEQCGLEEPSIDVEPREIGGGDALENVRQYLEPLEATITRNILAAREQRILLNASEEKLAVLRVCSGNPVEVAVSGLAAQSVARSYGSIGETSALLSVATSGGGASGCREHGILNLIVL
jgi:hypothetical protein